MLSFLPCDQNALASINTSLFLYEQVCCVYLSTFILKGIFALVLVSSLFPHLPPVHDQSRNMAAKIKKKGLREKLFSTWQINQKKEKNESTYAHEWSRQPGVGSLLFLSFSLFLALEPLTMRNAQCHTKDQFALLFVCPCDVYCRVVQVVALCSC